MKKNTGQTLEVAAGRWCDLWKQKQAYRIHPAVEFSSFSDDFDINSICAVCLQSLRIRLPRNQTDATIEVRITWYDSASGIYYGSTAQHTNNKVEAIEGFKDMVRTKDPIWCFSSISASLASNACLILEYIAVPSKQQSDKASVPLGWSLVRPSADMSPTVQNKVDLPVLPAQSTQLAHDSAIQEFPIFAGSPTILLTPNGIRNARSLTPSFATVSNDVFADIGVWQMPQWKGLCNLLRPDEIVCHNEIVGGLQLQQVDDAHASSDIGNTMQTVIPATPYPITRALLPRLPLHIQNVQFCIPKLFETELIQFYARWLNLRHNAEGTIATKILHRYLVIRLQSERRTIESMIVPLGSNRNPNKSTVLFPETLITESSRSNNVQYPSSIILGRYFPSPRCCMKVSLVYEFEGPKPTRTSTTSSKPSIEASDFTVASRLVRRYLLSDVNEASKMNSRRIRQLVTVGAQLLVPFDGERWHLGSNQDASISSENSLCVPLKAPINDCNVSNGQFWLTHSRPHAAAIEDELNTTIYQKHVNIQCAFACQPVSAATARQILFNQQGLQESFPEQQVGAAKDSQLSEEIVDQTSNDQKHPERITESLTKRQAEKKRSSIQQSDTLERNKLDKSAAKQKKVKDESPPGSPATLGSYESLEDLSEAEEDAEYFNRYAKEEQEEEASLDASASFEDQYVNENGLGIFSNPGGISQSVIDRLFRLPIKEQPKVDTKFETFEQIGQSGPQVISLEPKRSVHERETVVPELTADSTDQHRMAQDQPTKSDSKASTIQNHVQMKSAVVDTKITQVAKSSTQTHESIEALYTSLAPVPYRPWGGYISRAARTRLSRYGFHDILLASYETALETKSTIYPNKNISNVSASIDGMRHWRDRDKARQIQTQQQQLHQLQSLPWAVEQANLDVDFMEERVPDLSVEMSDTYHIQRICIELCTLIPNPWWVTTIDAPKNEIVNNLQNNKRSQSSSQTSMNSVIANTPKSIYVTCSFYTCDELQTDVITCQYDTQSPEESPIFVLHPSTRPTHSTHPLKHSSPTSSLSKSCRLTFDVNLSNATFEEKQHFYHYLAEHMLQLEIWDAESRLYLGQCLIPLLTLLRAQQPRKVIAREYDIRHLDVWNPQNAHMTSTRGVDTTNISSDLSTLTTVGRLQVILSNTVLSLEQYQSQNRLRYSENMVSVPRNRHLGQQNNRNQPSTVVGNQPTVAVAKRIPLNAHTRSSTALAFMQGRGAGRVGVSESTKNVKTVAIASPLKQTPTMLNKTQASHAQTTKSSYFGNPKVISLDEINTLKRVLQAENSVNVQKLISALTGTTASTATRSNGANGAMVQSQLNSESKDSTSFMHQTGMNQNVSASSYLTEQDRRQLRPEQRVKLAIEAHLAKQCAQENIPTSSRHAHLSKRETERGSMVYEAFDNAAQYVREKQRVAHEYVAQRPYPHKRRGRSNRSHSTFQTTTTNDNTPRNETTNSDGSFSDQIQDHRDDDYLSDSANPLVQTSQEHPRLTNGETRTDIYTQEMTLGRFRYVLAKTIKLHLQDHEWNDLCTRFASDAAQNRTRGAASKKPELFVVEYRAFLDTILNAAFRADQLQRQTQMLHIEDDDRDTTLVNSMKPSSTQTDIDLDIENNHLLRVTRAKVFRALSNVGRGTIVAGALYLNAIFQSVNWKQLPSQSETFLEWNEIYHAMSQYLDLGFEIKYGSLFSSSFAESTLYDKSLQLNVKNDDRNRVLDCVNPKQNEDQLKQVQFDPSIAERQIERALSVQQDNNTTKRTVQSTMFEDTAVIQLYKESRKREMIGRMLRAQFTIEYSLTAIFGQITFFEHTIVNPLPHEDRIKVIIKDPLEELRLVTDMQEWRYLREFGKRTEPDYGLRQIGNYKVNMASSDTLPMLPFNPEGELLLRPGEVVTLPFVYFSQKASTTISTDKSLTNQINTDTSYRNNATTDIVSNEQTRIHTQQTIRTSDPIQLNTSLSCPVSFVVSEKDDTSSNSNMIITRTNQPNKNESISYSTQDDTHCNKAGSMLGLDRTINVAITSATHSRVFAILSVQMNQRPFVTNRTLRFFVPEMEYNTATVGIPKQQTKSQTIHKQPSSMFHMTKPVPDSYTLRKRFVYCPDPNIILDMTSGSGISSELDYVSIRFRSSKYPHPNVFYIFVYNDSYCVSLYETWRVVVHPLMRYAITASAGSRITTDVGARGKENTTMAGLYISTPFGLRDLKSNMENVLEENDTQRNTDTLISVSDIHSTGVNQFLVSPTQYTRIPLTFCPSRPGIFHYQVNLVELETKKTISAWHVAATALEPRITKTYTVMLPTASLSNKSIAYANPWQNHRTFYIKSSNPQILQLKQPQITLMPQETGQIKLTFMPRIGVQADQVLLYINDENHQTLETLKLRVRYADAQPALRVTN